MKTNSYSVKPVKAHRHYNSPENIRKMSEALQEAKQQYSENPDDMHVSISAGNRKMGAIPSVSLLPVITCPNGVPCAPDCYALKTALVYPSCRKAYARNTAIALLNPAQYFAEISEFMKTAREIRFHVSGDIPNGAYFDNIVKCCRENPHCSVLCFTKRFSVVNTWIAQNGPLPDNLHILFSAWEGFKPVNPYNLPETNVLPIGTEPEPEQIVCGGKCMNCRCHNTGCWALRNGETLWFYLH